MIGPVDAEQFVPKSSSISTNRVPWLTYSYLAPICGDGLLGGPRAVLIVASLLKNVIQPSCTGRSVSSIILTIVLVTLK